MYPIKAQHPSVVRAYLDSDDDGDNFLVFEVDAVLYPEIVGFNQTIRDEIEDELFSLFRKYSCLGARLVSHKTKT